MLKEEEEEEDEGERAVRVYGEENAVNNDG